MEKILRILHIYRIILHNSEGKKRERKWGGERERERDREECGCKSIDVMKEVLRKMEWNHIISSARINTVQNREKSSKSKTTLFGLDIKIQIQLWKIQKIFVLFVVCVYFSSLNQNFCKIWKATNYLRCWKSSV